MWSNATVLAKVEWEDPPRRSTAPRWEDLLREVARRPGQWARIVHYPGETSAYRLARQLRDRDDLPPGHWEFTARRDDAGGSSLYARLARQPERDGREAVTDRASELARHALRSLLDARGDADADAVLCAFVLAVGGEIGRRPRKRMTAVEFTTSGEPRVALAPEGSPEADSLLSLLPELVGDWMRLRTRRAD